MRTLPRITLAFFLVLALASGALALTFPVTESTGQTTGTSQAVNYATGMVFRTNTTGLILQNVTAVTGVTATYWYIVNSTNNITCKFTLANSSANCALPYIGVYAIMAGSDNSSYTRYYESFSSYPIVGSVGNWTSYTDASFTSCQAIGCELRRDVNSTSFRETVKSMTFTQSGGGGGTANNITVTLNDNVTGQAISGFCVNVTGNGTTYNCTAGTAIQVINVTGSLTFDYSNITGGAASPTYFNVSTTASVTTDQTVNTQSWQAILNLSAYRLFLNTSIGAFNVTNNLTANLSSNAPVYIKARNGTNNLQIAVAGNYTVNVTCTVPTPLQTYACNVTGIYDALFKINATDALTDAQVTTFTVQMSNSTLGGNLTLKSTTNGTLQFPAIRDYAYQFDIDPTGYSLANTTQNVTNASFFYEFSLTSDNSLFLFFFDATSLLPIDFQNVTVLFTLGNVSFSNTSATGDMIRSGLTPGTYTLAVTSSGYDPAQYFVTIVNRTTQSLDIFLLNSSVSGDTVFTVKDAVTTNTITGISVTMQQLISGSYVTIGQETSDAFGVVFFPLTQGETYQFITSGAGYDPKSGVFVRTQDTYTIILNQNNSQNFVNYVDFFSYRIQPTYIDLGVNSFNLTVSSPNGTMDWFAIVLNLNGTNTTDNITSSPSGGTAIVLANLTPYQGQTVTAYFYMQTVGIAYPLIVSRSWTIGIPNATGNYTFTDFMTYYADDANGLDFYSRGIMLTLAAVILGAILGFVFGLGAAVIWASTVYIFGAMMGWIHPTIAIVVVGALLGSFVIGRRS